MIQIVTGAPNVKEGDKVPVVLDGGRVAGGHDGKMTPGGIRIKAGKLRGVPSKRHDVLHRRAGKQPGYVSGSPRIWNLYIPGKRSCR